MMLRKPCLLGASLALLLATPSLAQTSATTRAPIAATASHLETLSYQVLPGDTLIDLARAYMLRATDYRQVQSLNRVRDPRRLRIGQTLELPIHLLKTQPEQAVVSSFRGNVQLDTGHGVRTPVQGQYVPEGAMIVTGANAFIRLALTDGSHVVVPSNSRVRVSRLRRYIINDAVDHGLTVERGRLENQVAPRRRPGGFVVNTPVSVSAVRGTEFRIAINEATNSASTEVLEGHVEVDNLITTTEGDAMANYAILANASGLTHVVLLPAPALLRPKAVVTTPKALVDLKPLSGASTYRGRLATDAGMVEAFAETDSLQGQEQLDFGSLDDGIYYLQLSALSDQGVEGRSTVYRLIRVRNELGGLAADRLTDLQLETYRFRWEDRSPAGTVDEAPYYRFVLYRQDEAGQAIGAPLVDRPGLTDTSMNLTRLEEGVYGWRVQISRHKFGQLVETWSDAQTLRIGQ